MVNQEPRPEKNFSIIEGFGLVNDQNYPTGDTGIRAIFQP